MKIFISSCILFFSLTAIAQNTPCILDLGDGNCLVKVNEDYGMKKKNKFIIPAFFDTIIPMEYHHYMAYQNGRKGVFDKKGRMIVPVSYTDVIPLSLEKDLFEVIGTGMRSVITSPAVNKVKNYRKVNDLLLVSAFEVSIIEYLAIAEFAKTNEKYKDLPSTYFIPDTNAMSEKTRGPIRYFLNNDGKKYNESYSFDFASLSFRVAVPFSDNILLDKKAMQALDYPITGITYEQAITFCKIKSELFNQELNPFENENISFRFRLPRLFEWEEFATSGLPNEEMKKRAAMDSLNSKGCQLFHYQFSFTCESIQSFEKKLGPGLSLVQDYYPNSDGINQLFGNVAEMIEEKGYAKGGSYLHYAKDAEVKMQLTYKKPEPWLGFRPVLEYFVTQ
ncbi:MAG: SUMF1/EgtB/PvdO family nonheme iron enzyme [Flavobacteriales bacterium]|nr:SUMF1/EgtB/PvdO family nonheme iron enzyme [Flavobacteriales bacterium]